jgi:hypothetical protein
MAYRLLTEFERLFEGRVYNHRVSTHGDWVAIHLYEDLYDLGRSQTFRKRVDARTRVITSANRAQGTRSRRGDGTFGEIVPNEQPIIDPGYRVARARTATIEIGLEVKIVAKAMMKQIDRVCSDLRNQHAVFRRIDDRCITVGLVGINHAPEYVSYEGSRRFATTGTHGFVHPAREASAAALALQDEVANTFDYFLILRFTATNSPPYLFQGVDPTGLARDYGAMLVRISKSYDERFGTGD